MAEPYFSEIRMMAFEPDASGSRACDGAEMSLQQNQALFSLLATAFGGDGARTFRLPDLRGNIPVHKTTARGVGDRTREQIIAEQPAGSGDASPGCMPIWFAIAFNGQYPTER
jgi:microcystin-dependent protein